MTLFKECNGDRYQSVTEEDQDFPEILDIKKPA